MNAIPAIRLRLSDNVRSFLIFFAALVLITVLITSGLISFVISGSEVSGGIFSAGTISISIYAFVLGICAAREDMRLLIQFGISRRTSYLTRLCSAFLLCVIGAVAVELLLALGSLLAGKNMEVVDLYQILYKPENFALSFGDHLRAAAMNCALMLALYEFGEFFSLIFLHTRKAGTIALGIFIGIFPGIILPAIVSIPMVRKTLAPAVIWLFKWMAAGVWNFVAAVCVGLVVLLAVNFLLIRRAPITAAKK